MEPKRQFKCLEKCVLITEPGLQPLIICCLGTCADELVCRECLELYRVGTASGGCFHQGKSKIFSSVMIYASFCDDERLQGSG